MLFRSKLYFATNRRIHGTWTTTIPSRFLDELPPASVEITESKGGTAWGDIFMVNIDRCSDPCQQLRQIVRSGHAWYTDHWGRPVQSNLNLDRVLHHEERHSAQWAAKGYLRMLRDYSWELIRERVSGATNRLEDDAGLSDGGYR